MFAFIQGLVFTCIIASLEIPEFALDDGFVGGK
jgi:hypothetical protein